MRIKYLNTKKFEIKLSNHLVAWNKYLKEKKQEKSKNILFLDFDWVFNTSRVSNRILILKKQRRTTELSASIQLLKNLEYIIKKLKNWNIAMSASVVKKRAFIDLIQYYKLHNFPINKIVWDTFPSRTSPPYDKCQAIKKYIKENKINSFLVLDDESLKSITPKNSLVREIYKNHVEIDCRTWLNRRYIAKILKKAKKTEKVK